MRKTKYEFVTITTDEPQELANLRLMEAIRCYARAADTMPLDSLCSLIRGGLGLADTFPERALLAHESYPLPRR